MARYTGGLLEDIQMQAKSKSVNTVTPNIWVIIGLIVLTLLTVFGIVFSWVEGQYLFSGAGIVLIYLMFMGSDVFCRKCNRSK